MIPQKYEDTIKVCNCAGCRKELMSRDHLEFWAELVPSEQKKYPEFVAGRVKDRPYCVRCLFDIQSGATK